MYSDSQRAIRALKSETSEIRKMAKIIQKNLNEIQSKQIVIAWIPGHAGVQGNEATDRLAKPALGNNSVDEEVATGGSEK